MREKQKRYIRYNDFGLFIFLLRVNTENSFKNGGGGQGKRANKGDGRN